MPWVLARVGRRGGVEVRAGGGGVAGRGRAEAPRLWGARAPRPLAEARRQLFKQSKKPASLKKTQNAVWCVL